MYLRFYPSILGAILMYYLLPLVGTGPFWYLADKHYVASCRNFLLPNLLSYNYYMLDLEEFFHSSMVCFLFISYKNHRAMSQWTILL